MGRLPVDAEELDPAPVSASAPVESALEYGRQEENIKERNESEAGTKTLGMMTGTKVGVGKWGEF